jgi:hypothetical protein
VHRWILHVELVKSLSTMLIAGNGAARAQTIEWMHQLGSTKRFRVRHANDSDPSHGGDSQLWTIEPTSDGYIGCDSYS